jgi:hypothetical protein
LTPNKKYVILILLIKMAAAPAAIAAPTEAERRLNFCKMPNMSPIFAARRGGALIQFEELE